MLQVEGLSKTYNKSSRARVRAVNNVSFSVEKGQIVSLIGESGSGKSTIGNMVLQLTKPSSGRILFGNQDITRQRSRSSLKEYYRKVQGVFQDPFSTFNPIFRVDRVFAILHREFFPNEAAEAWQQRVEAALLSVGLTPAAVCGAYCHQLSGGQLQRILIARALLLEAELLVADEIISMLDASTRIDVLNLLGEMRERGLSMMFVTHDLSLGYYISDRVIILYKGVMVESGNTQTVFSDPQHPYSRSLLEAVPRLDVRWDELPPRPASRHEAAMFNPDCDKGSPRMEQIGEDHWIAVRDCLPGTEL
ncbi:MAG: ABC transporter ATP-binding protein [Spirochaetes bacterium]|nr:ABC transporter ATP-binding protein [Spirochaetota bacterium]MBU0956562.1 ABC transporter ATP-binding protein [Spirochaetota bacterium]